MPTQTRSGGKPSAAATTYRSTVAAPKQQEFSHRRRSAKTYGRRKPAPKLKQGTLTQMDFTSSAMRDFADLVDDDDGEETEAKDEDEEAEVDVDVELEPYKPVKIAKDKTKSRGSRRKTAGDELDIEENSRQSKRRRTLGDSPGPTASSSFHTQTLTQMMSISGTARDPWQIEDSQDNEDFDTVQTPQKESAYISKTEPQGGTGSAIPSLVQSVTPVNRQRKTEIPSSQSPATPMLLRYSPAPRHSPLIAKSTNVGAPSSILKSVRKTPRHAVIPDSYSTAHDSSPTPARNSTVNATPSRHLRFDLPDDKENITPGRTKPKSPKSKSQPTGRQPLHEVPDSDEESNEDLDETEYETEGEGDTAGDPETPTPKRFRNSIPFAKDPETDPDPPEAVGCASTGSDVLGGEFPNQEPSLDPNSEIESTPGQASPSPSGPQLERRLLHSENPKVPVEYPQVAPMPDPEPQTEVNAETPRPAQTEQNTVRQAAITTIREALETALPERAGSDESDDSDGSDDAIDGISPSQDFLYTQGLESQRLPLDSIRALGPQTPHSDIMVSLHPEHIGRIVDRTKNHEFRAWKIPQQVSRLWIYITRPESQLKYMCLFGEPKTPGEIQDENGVGNVDFNHGKMAAKFAYEILQVYELNNPVSLDEMKKKGWVAGAPQKYTYIPPAVVGELTANLRCALFEDTSQSEGTLPKHVSESDELKAQLQNDVDYSTQHYSEMTDEVIPASQSPRNDNTNSEKAVDKTDLARPALSGVRSTSSNHGSPPLPDQRQRRSVRPSQATTVSQVSSSPAISPSKPGHRPIFLSSQSGGSSPTALRRPQSSLRSSQFATRSQLMPDSLLNDDIQEPPPIVWDSADEHSD
ncbi:hypothetical protein SAMD00023353_3001250 [Rosellinia necatrix]|uniref:Uncharacterized protein n=1 Tax=Rosellinia necatrix TaxID=77044 RepID=A0A1W2TJD0_ROSNE|nr:hypothetical protein SAMD00023353_3001250 [Rosellinia necatrix]